MRVALSLALSGILVAPALAAAEVIHFRMAPDPTNDVDCSALDPGLRGLHTVTLKDGVAMISSTGGLEGRLTRQRPGVYGIAFELAGHRLDGIAYLDGSAARLVVMARDGRCRWAGTAE